LVVAPARIREHDRAFIRPTVPGVHTISIYFRHHGISCRNRFTPPRHGIIYDKPKNNIMVSLWCMEKNSIAEMVKDPENFNTALVPCKGSDCPRWGERGGCIMLFRVGKHGRE